MKTDRKIEIPAGIFALAVLAAAVFLFVVGTRIGAALHSAFHEHGAIEKTGDGVMTAH